MTEREAEARVSVVGGGGGAPSSYEVNTVRNLRGELETFRDRSESLASANRDLQRQVQVSSARPSLPNRAVDGAGGARTRTCGPRPRLLSACALAQR